MNKIILVLAILVLIVTFANCTSRDEKLRRLRRRFQSKKTEILKQYLYQKRKLQRTDMFIGDSANFDFLNNNNVLKSKRRSNKWLKRLRSRKLRQRLRSRNLRQRLRSRKLRQKKRSRKQKKSPRNRKSKNRKTKFRKPKNRRSSNKKKNRNGVRNGCIKFYEHNNKEGKSIQICSTKSLKKLERLGWNDKASSLCAGNGSKWRLWQHNFEGSHIDVRPGRCIRNLAKYHFNDNISSMNKWAPNYDPNSVKKGCIRLFAQKRKGGASITICRDQKISFFNRKSWNDRAESVCAGKGASWILYEHANLHAMSYFIRSGKCVNDLGNGGFKGRTSAIIKVAADYGKFGSNDHLPWEKIEKGGKFGDDLAKEFYEKYGDKTKKILKKLGKTAAKKMAKGMAKKIGTKLASKVVTKAVGALVSGTVGAVAGGVLAGVASVLGLIGDAVQKNKCKMPCCPRKGQLEGNFACKYQMKHSCMGFYSAYPGHGDHACWWNEIDQRCEVGIHCRNQSFNFFNLFGSFCPPCTSDSRSKPQMAKKTLKKSGLLTSWYVNENKEPLWCSVKESRHNRCSSNKSKRICLTKRGHGRGKNTNCKWSRGRCVDGEICRNIDIRPTNRINLKYINGGWTRDGLRVDGAPMLKRKIISENREKKIKNMLNKEMKTQRFISCEKNCKRLRTKVSKGRCVLKCLVKKK